MSDAWEVLAAWGLPLGAPRTQLKPPATADVSTALATLAAQVGRLDETERECLLGWLRALQHHWPAAFARLAGPPGVKLVEALQATSFDPNRYLKLRRIAIANLARLV